LTVHGVASDDVSGHVEFGQQLLHGRDLVGFLIDFDVSEHQRRIDRERAEHLFGLGVVEIVEAALQRLAVERDDAGLSRIGREIEEGGVFAKHLFDIRGVEPLQNISDGRMRRRPFPLDLEGFVQRSQMRLAVCLDAAIRIGPAHDGQNGKQQDVRQPIEFALGAARVGDCGEQREKWLQGLHGDLRSIRSPHTDSDFFARRNRPLPLTHQDLGNCCIWDSVESVEQP
jgi:hypothetical protein